jgi:hypothetical protein
VKSPHIRELDSAELWRLLRRNLAMLDPEHHGVMSNNMRKYYVNLAFGLVGELEERMKSASTLF